MWTTLYYNRWCCSKDCQIEPRLITDIQSAFRVLPIYLTDCHLLAICWKQRLYIDIGLPFKLNSAPKLFNILAYLLSWIILKHGASSLFHYLDDFLTIRSPTSVCYLQTKFKHHHQDLWGTWSTPGIRELRNNSVLKQDWGTFTTGQADMHIAKTDQLARQKATKKKILLLVGSLHHAAELVYYCRIFHSGIYVTAAKVKNWITSPVWTWSFVQISCDGTFFSLHGMVVVYSGGIPFNTPSPLQSRLMLPEHWAMGLCLKILGFSNNGPQKGNHVV